MAIGSVGLQTHIWNNNIKSLVMLAAYPIVILGVAWGCTFAVNSVFLRTPEPVVVQHGEYWSTIGNIALTNTNQMFAGYWLYIMGVLALWFLIAYMGHQQMIMKMSGAHTVFRKNEPELYNLLENLCIAEGMPMPQLNVIESHGRNAFASGINENTFAITVSRGLMNSLKKDELEAVLAHELSHIRHRDVRLMVITLVFTGMVGVALQMVGDSFRSVRYYHGNGRGQGRSIIIGVLLYIVLSIAYLLTNFMRFFISRKREFMADAGAVEMTKNPDAMMRALMRISGRDRMIKTNNDIAMMYIENSRKLFGIFATHPPIDKRIEALAVVNNMPVPDIKSLGPVTKESRLSRDKKSSKQNPWLTRARRSSAAVTKTDLWTSYEDDK